LERQIDAGDAVVAKVYADVLAHAGNAAKAITLLRPIAQAGDAEAALRVAQLLINTDLPDEAVTWLTRHPSHKAIDTLRRLAERFERDGRPSAAIAVYQKLAEIGDTHDLIQAVRRTEQYGRATTIMWLHARIDAGDTTALRLAAELCERRGQIDDATRWYRRVTEAGNASGIERIARLLEMSDRSDEARQLRQFGLVPGGATAEPWSATQT
jgi:TPR repeat protein